MKLILWALPAALLAVIPTGAIAAAPETATFRVDLAEVDRGDRQQVKRQIDRAVRAFCRSEMAHLDPRARRSERRCAAELNRKLAKYLSNSSPLVADRGDEPMAGAFGVR